MLRTGGKEKVIEMAGQETKVEGLLEKCQVLCGQQARENGLT